MFVSNIASYALKHKKLPCVLLKKRHKGLYFLAITYAVAPFEKVHSVKTSYSNRFTIEPFSVFDDQLKNVVISDE